MTEDALSAPRPNRFGYLQGNQPRDLSTLERLQQLARNGQIPAATTSDLARRQIENLSSQNQPSQNEGGIRATEHPMRGRRESRRREKKVRPTDRHFFGRR